MSSPPDNETPTHPEHSSRNAVQSATSWILGLCGAAVGAAIGVLIFGWLLRHGFHGLAIPGALLGLGFGLASKRQSTAMGVVCGVLALVVGVLAEWRYRPFIDDASLTYFIKNLTTIPVSLAMILLGAALAFWFGRGR